MAQIPNVTITVGLLEKLAGIKKPEIAKGLPGVPTTQRPGHPVSARTALSPEAAKLLQQDAQLSKALVASRQVGNLLLKHESEELSKVQQRAEQLVNQYRIPLKAVPCETERQQCLRCYDNNPLDALKCAEFARAYSACASSLAGSAA